MNFVGLADTPAATNAIACERKKERYRPANRSPRPSLLLRHHFPAFLKFIEMISPDLHHLHALWPVFCCVYVCATHVVRFLVGKLALDCIGIPPPHFVQPDRCHRAETVCGHLLRAITEPT